MRYFPICIFFVALFNSCHHSQSPLNVGSVTKIDRELITAEWQNAASFKVNDSIIFRAMIDNDHLFLLVDYLESDSLEYRWLELFLDNGTDIFRLHASGQLGQQVKSEQNWSEDWNWGNNEHWIATKHGLNTPENRAYEFSINRKSLTQSTVKLMVVAFIADKTKGFDIKPFELIFPKNSNRSNSASWHQLNLY